VSGSVVRGPMPPLPVMAPLGSPPSGAAGPGLANSSGARVLDFRRRGAPPRRRRRHPLLLLLRPLAVAVLVVLLPLGLAAWVLTSRRFELADVVVEGGTQRVKPAWVRQALAPYRGKNLVRLPLTELAEAVQKNPWVQSVELQKELPGRLRVALTERRPVALLRSGVGGRGARGANGATGASEPGGLVYADPDGQPIVEVDSVPEARKAGLLEVFFSRPVPGGMAGALEVAGELGRVRPDWAAALTRIDVLGEEDFRLHTEALPFPLLVTRGEVGPKARRLEELLPELERRYPVIESVDLRFSRRIVVQPGIPAAGTGAVAGAQT
jgi:cell division protein FtsQ